MSNPPTPPAPVNIAELAKKIHYMICDESQLIGLALTSLRDQDLRTGEPLVRSIKYFNDEIFELTQALRDATKTTNDSAGEDAQENSHA